MNRLYAGLAGAVLLGFYTWAVYGWGRDSCAAKVETGTVKEQARQATGAGELKAGDIQHGQRIKSTKQAAIAAPAPLGCDGVDIGDVRAAGLGGVRD